LREERSGSAKAPFAARDVGMIKDRSAD